MLRTEHHWVWTSDTIGRDKPKVELVCTKIYMTTQEVVLQVQGGVFCCYFVWILFLFCFN